MKMVQKDQIGERIRCFALSKHLSIKDFADFIGMDPGNVQKYLKSKRKPGTPFLQKLQTDGCNLTWLLTGEGEMYEDDEKTSYLNAHKKVEKDRLNGLRSVYPPAVFPPTGPTTKALGKAMYIENIIEGDDIYITAGAIAKPGDMVLTLGEGYSKLSRFKDGDPQPYAICTYLTRNLQQPAKPSQESEN